MLIGISVLIGTVKSQVIYSLPSSLREGSGWRNEAHFNQISHAAQSPLRVMRLLRSHRAGHSDSSMPIYLRFKLHADAAVNGAASAIAFKFYNHHVFVWMRRWRIGSTLPTSLAQFWSVKCLWLKLVWMFLNRVNLRWECKSFDAKLLPHQSSFFAMALPLHYCNDSCWILQASPSKI